MKKLGVCGESPNKLGYKVFIDYPPVDELEIPALLDHFPLLKKKKSLEIGAFSTICFSTQEVKIYIYINRAFAKQ